ncbi:putative O-antigen transporter [Oenococcus oeni]|uniref:flippase n=1 Tax=Oenococcus oeni TaxID=1247 RepID=UPI0010B4FFC3|nr:flippase [Oenococcus oeni]SYW12249.1 putative O-antigen transporter [Oenococcus oeni]
MKIFKNYIYNLIFQILQLILPIVTTPYISRVLGPTGVGTNSYTASVASVFILVGSLGLNIHGQQEISIVRDDRAKVSLRFWQIFFLKMIFILFSLLVYILLIGFNGGHLFVYFLAQGVTFFSTILDISWFYMGLENFKKILYRNLIIKLLFVSLLFIFVRNKNDTITYILLINGLALLASLSFWYKIPIQKVRVIVDKKNLIYDLRSGFVLFLPQLAIQAYLVGDKIILGYLGGVKESGMFDSSNKMISMLLVVVSSIGTVTLPQLTNSFYNHQKKEFDKLIDNSFIFLNATSIPLMFGMWVVSDIFAPMFFGDKFTGINILIDILAPIFVLNSWSTVIGYQYLLATKQTKKYTNSVVCGAVVSLIICFLMIPKLGALGAAVGLTCAEFVTTLVQVTQTAREIQYRKILFSSWKYLAGSVLFFLVDMILKKLVAPKVDIFFSLLILIVVAGVIYVVFLYFTRADVLDLATGLLKKRRAKNG